jgi:hypothetical protein
MNVPQVYGGRELSVETRAALASARADWDNLSDSQRKALADHWGPSGGPLTTCPVRSRRALYVRGMVDRSEPRAALTAYGVLVREAGLRTRTRSEPRYEPGSDEEAEALEDAIGDQQYEEEMDRRCGL